MFRRLTTAFAFVVIILPLTLSAPFANAQQTQNQGTRCTGTNAEPLFLRFNYVPVQGQSYLENKAVIYVPKEAQCQGNFPMYIHLHGDNKYYDDISTYYLPETENGQPIVAHYRENGQEKSSRGSNNFPNQIKAAYANNPHIPGMIFVLPAKTFVPNTRNSKSVNWTGLDGNEIRRLVQEKLNTDPRTSNLHITVSTDTLISGHSGAGCQPNDGGSPSTIGLLQFQNVNPKAVGVLDTCTSNYRRESTTYPNATILYYAAQMAYTGATWSNGNESGGYHNALPAGFQNLASCDAHTFLNPPNPAATHHEYGIDPESGVSSRMTDEQKTAQRERNAHFRHYWEAPVLGCSKNADHPWYGLFATEMDHANAVGFGMRTLLNLVYTTEAPQQVTAPNQPAQNTTQGSNQPSGNNPIRVSAPTISGSVPLEVDINGISSISGNNQGFIVNYTRILFLYAGGLAGTLALLILIVAGIQLIIGGGGDKNTQSKQLIMGSLTGLVLLASSGWILYLINPCFFTFGSNPVCVPRGAPAVSFNYAPDSTAPQSSNTTFNLNGTPPRPVAPTCANGVCDVVLNVPYINQTEAKRECAYDNLCIINPTAGDELTNSGGASIHSTEKWGQVSCGAAAYSLAYMYVSGNTSSAKQFLDTFINNYYRCGIHGLSPAASARIGGYDAHSAPRTANDNLCGYVLGSGAAHPTVFVNILRSELHANGTHTTDLTSDAIYTELSRGHPIVIGGVGALHGRTGGFEPREHYTVLVGIQGYNQTNHTFTNLVIHDVGHEASSIMTFANYHSLQAQNLLQSGIAVAM